MNINIPLTHIYKTFIRRSFLQNDEKKKGENVALVRGKKIGHKKVICSFWKNSKDDCQQIYIKLILIEISDEYYILLRNAH